MEKVSDGIIHTVPLGIYISVPFCRTKCSFCNFASDVFSRAVFDHYVDRLCADMVAAELQAGEMGAEFERAVDSIYLGGGTPSLLEPAQLERLFSRLRDNFEVQPGTEITVECAPGTLTQKLIECLTRCGVNRVSLGVQSFVDAEAAAVGRLHKRAIVLEEINRLQAAGISDINIDLIAGLPHQTPESWEYSLAETIATGSPHVSVYMLEVDEDSRLGRELLAGGTRYHAHFVPDDDLTADFYEEACRRLAAAEIGQYEISNFARAGFESLHNLKYWTRQPYLGFGVDAHSMLRVKQEAHDFTRPDRSVEVRFACPDQLELYTGGVGLEKTLVTERAALQEALFLGLRLNRGVETASLRREFGDAAVAESAPVFAALDGAGLLRRENGRLFLTPRGRLLSNEVFQRLI